MAGYGGAPGWDVGAGMGMPQAAGAGTPAMLSQFLGRMLGDGQSWVAVMIFGGPMADQLRQYQQLQFLQSQFAQSQFAQSQFMQPQSTQSPFPQSQFAQSPQAPPYAAPAPPGSGSLPGYDAQYGAMAQAYQQAYQWAAQQQAMIAAAQQPPPALTAGPDAADMPQYAPPAVLPPAEETQAYGGMLNQDWAGWLGQTSQSIRPEPQEVELEDPYEQRRGGRLSGRFGAAMRELRGK